jgi:hypothetical protein
VRRDDYVIAVGWGTVVVFGLVLVAILFGALVAAPDDRPRAARATPGEPRDFSSCFESVVPRAQFYCGDGIWTRQQDGTWRVDLPSPMPKTPAGQ